MFTKGAKIEITREARAYSCAGYVDPTYIIPASVEVVTVKSTRKTNRGLKVHFVGADHGFAMYVDQVKATFRAAA